MGHVAGAGCRTGRPAELVRPVLSTALFAHADSEQDTAVFGTLAAVDLVPAVVRQVHELLAGLATPGPGEVDVTAPRAEPGLVLVTAGTGPGAQLGVQVVDHAELLVRDRVETLSARRDRFRAAYGRDAAWFVLLAGDLTDHRARQRVQSVQARFAWDGDLVVAPQYSAGFLRLRPAELDQLAARVTLTSCAGRPAG